jgi:hypothetical protein
VFSPLARVLRMASLVICLIAIASFVLFVVNQTSSASSHQQEVLNNGAVTTTAGAGASGAPSGSPPHKSSVHRAIDDASNALTSPFSGVTAGSSSEWVIRGANLLLALVVYGFGLGFLARTIRVRI